MSIAAYPEFFVPHKPITSPQHIYDKNARAKEIIISKPSLFEP
jgi:hypothetical protein